MRVRVGGGPLRKVAVKVYDKARMASDARKRKNLQREVNILSRLDHLNIVKIHESFETSSRVKLHSKRVEKM